LKVPGFACERGPGLGCRARSQDGRLAEGGARQHHGGGADEGLVSEGDGRRPDALCVERQRADHAGRVAKVCPVTATCWFSAKAKHLFMRIYKVVLAWAWKPHALWKTSRCA
jgi:hypothetical protein